MARLLTLLTDFGTRDSYVAAMKGVIAQIDRTLQSIDLTHDIEPQDVYSARFCLMTAYPYFPPETVHVAVVDPGVGSSRRAIAVQLENGFLVAPDNGLVSGVLSQFSAVAAVELTNSAYWRVAKTSCTFHGRDIFAPVGAHLARGVPLAELGNPIDLHSLIQLSLPNPASTKDGWTGCIQAIDRFGNLITNIPADVLPPRWFVSIAQTRIAGSFTYADRPVGELLALVGSHGFVEIAINCGSAQAALKLAIGTPIKIQNDIL
ncbi:SAM-dependent chlorinase/fluorinase [Microcoleus sp. FACHB-1515]|uniref:SAM-dependent chlorinase/fluorinase n=1 Tax=Cyanophyceae TaxID=3028117 RepID=UPI001689575B|nr:SAM-dependent chlorinase/fluorinase [Microcoleus sp. FACHB-1515]